MTILGIIEAMLNTHPDFGRRTGKYKRLRKLFRDDCERRNAVCWLDGKPIDYSLPFNHPESFELDHDPPKSLRPDLAEDPIAFRASHRDCNRRRGNDKSGPIDIGIPSEQW